MKLLLHNLGSNRYVTVTKLTTEEGVTVRCIEQWIPRSDDHMIWGRYVTNDGQRGWWFDHGKVLDVEKTAKGKRKPIPVDIPEIDPPPADAICGVRTC